MHEGLFFLLGVLIGKYLFPICDMAIDVLEYKFQEKVTKYQLKSQEMACEFTKKYPDILKQNQNDDMPAINAIGFSIPQSYDENEYYEDI